VITDSGVVDSPKKDPKTANIRPQTGDR
jgi:hypothetical protein